MTLPPPTEPPSRTWRKTGWAIPAIAGLVSGASVASAPFLTGAVPDGRPPPGSPVVVEVQNKVAVGRSELREDQTPASLSTTTEPHCARSGCSVPDTQFNSGAVLVAVCRRHGAELANYNRDEAGIADNPNRVATDEWYRIVLPDGRSGYISEVYLTPASRGGRRLPFC